MSTRGRGWLVVLLLFLLLGLPSLGLAERVSITFFDVGQGDAALLVSPSGKRVLIDGGPPESATRLLEALRKMGVDQVDLVLLSHPHLDHLGGLATIVEGLAVRTFLDAGFSHPSPAYTNLIESLARRGVVVRNAAAGRAIDLGGEATLTLLGPPVPFLTGTRSDANANSVVARLTWRQATALFVGDAEPETERWLLGSGAVLGADLLKVAHHGGHYSSTDAFLQAVQPKMAVISAGAHNVYGHPTPAAMARLRAVGARVYRTDQDGDVTLRTDGQEWTAVVTGVNRGAPTSPDPSLGTSPTVPWRAKEGQPVASYVASQRSRVFHLPSCANAAAIKQKNLLSFASREAALASARRPAGDCHP